MGRRLAAARAPPPGAAEGAPRPATCGRVGKLVGWAAQVSPCVEEGRVKRRGGGSQAKVEGKWRSEVRARTLWQWQ